eukprot:gene25602-1711_t
MEVPKPISKETQLGVLSEKDTNTSLALKQAEQELKDEIILEKKKKAEEKKTEKERLAKAKEK